MRQDTLTHIHNYDINTQFFKFIVTHLPILIVKIMFWYMLVLTIHTLQYCILIQTIYIAIIVPITCVIYNSKCNRP